MKQQISYLARLYILSLILLPVYTLRVVTVLPAPTDTTDVVQVSYRDSITVILDKPGIALGGDWESDASIPFALTVDVPGNYRYVTTSIVRFDPEIDWPSDLEFGLTFKPIVSPTGETLNATTLSYKYVTPATTFFILNVQSAQASALTDNTWLSTLPFLDQDNNLIYSNEVPPDGIITLNFGTGIDLDMVGDQLQVQRLSDSQNIDFTYSNCNDSFSTNSCIILIPTSLSTEPDIEYVIKLPAQSKTSQYSGTTKSDTTIKFYGLYSFRFPLENNLGFNARKLALYLRHGLKDETAALDGFNNSINTNPPLPLTFEIPYPWMLTIEADFQPEISYTLIVSPNNNVLDGFGLPLIGSQVTFNMSAPSQIILSPDSDMVIFEDFPPDENWTIFSRNTIDDLSSNSYLIASNVDMDNLAQAIASYTQYGGSSYINSTTIQIPKSSGNVSITSFTPPFGVSGLWLLEYYQCNNVSWNSGELKLNSKWISRNNLGVSVIYTKNEVVVWVTTTDKNEKVQGAKVTIWGSEIPNPDPSSVKPLVNQDYITDSDGLAIISDLSMITSSLQAYVIVNYNELVQISLLEMQAPENRTAEVISTIITDRSFYAPGDTIYLKGYLQSRLDDVFTAPDVNQGQMSIQWNDDSSSYVSYDIPILPSGTFSYNITIPDDASSTQKYLEFNFGSYWTQAPILIATPRIPTISLSLSSSEVIFRPQKAYPLNISLETYTGLPVASGLVQIQWKVSKFRPYWNPLFSYELDALHSRDFIFLPPADTVIYSGVVEVSVDKNGQLTNYLLDLNDVSVQEGNSIKITAKYFSPTKEIAMKEISAPIAYSPLSLSIRPTVSGAILPDFPFGVFANVQDLSAGGNTISGTTVSVNLYSWDGFTIPTIDPQTGIYNIQGISLQDCTFQTLTSTTQPGCTDPGFSLPSIGNFLIVGTVKDSNNYVVTTIVPVGYNETEWKNNPRSSFNSVDFNLNKASYNQNDDVYLEFFNPYPQSLLLYYWGTAPNSQHKILTPTQGLNSILIKLGPECLYGCYLQVVLVSPRVSSGSADNSVPTSILFDPLSPDANYNTLPIIINVPARTINVSIITDDIVEPGKFTQLMINLTQEGNPVSGEVAIFIVDKAALDLKPNPIPFYNESLSNYWINQYYLSGMITDSRDRIASSAAYIKIKEIIQRRFQTSPWYSPNYWPVFPQSTLSEFDVTDEEFFDYYKSIITEFPVPLPLPPWLPRFMFREDSIAFDGASFTSTSTSDTSSAQPLTIRSNFKATALFVGYLEVDSTGSVVKPYTLPDNIGTFEIRAYAFNAKSSSFGVGVKDQITRRDFSLQPSLPRIVRYKDQFSAGVSLTIADPKFSGPVTVKVDRTCELLALAGPDSLSLQLTGSGPHLIEFRFVALGTGTAGLIFKVAVGMTDVTGGQHIQLKDAVYLLQDIVGQQEPVFIATSMPVSENSSDTEGFVKPEAVPYSGNLSISVGVGKVPAIETLAEIAINSKHTGAYPSADDLLASMVPYIALSKYSDSIASNYFNEFNDSIIQLKRYTHSTFGLQFYPIDVYPQQTFTCVRLQTFALYVLNEVKKLPNPDLLSSLDESATFWTNALINQLRSEVQARKQLNGIYDDYETLAFVYLALGTSYPFDVELQLSGVLNNTDNLSNQAKAALALALLRDNVETTTANNLLNQLTNTFRVQPRTAYISSNSWPNFLASGIALQAYVESKSTDVLVEKLSNFVAQDGVTDVWWWYSGEQLSHFMLGLSCYDLWKGNTNPQLNVTVISGKQVLLNSNFDTVDEPAAHTTYYFEDTGNDLITFTACCVGEASVVFGAKFVPLNLPVQKIERGITVNRIIQKVEAASNNATGPNIVEAEIGDMVMTTIQITVPDYSPSMRIVDPFPGALEPLDDNIYDYLPSNRFDPLWRWYWGAFPIKEFLQDKVVFHGQNIYPGTYTVSYYSIVNTQGSFVLSPALAFDEFQPELMGLSEAGTFSTVDYVVTPISNENSTCLLWINRTLTPEELQKYLNNYGLDNNSPDDPAIVDGFKADTDASPNINKPLALGLGLGIGIPVIILAIGSVIYFARSKRTELATIDPTTTVTSIPV